MTAAHEGSAIHAEALRKVYAAATGAVVAVDEIDLIVNRSELFGLLGPNGAGKSTTIGMLTTRVRPTSGRAIIGGRDTIRDPSAVRWRIGVVTQHNTLDRQLTVAENLEFRGRFFGMRARAARARAAEILDMFGLSTRGRAMVHELSGGQARRVMVGRALMHTPEILFLDEPTSGIDPQSRINLWDVLRTLHRNGQTILLSSHHMDEVEAHCGRVAIIDGGRILACDTVEGLKNSAGTLTVVTVVYEGDAADLVDKAQSMEGVSRSEADGDRLRVFTRNPDGVVGRLITLGEDEGLRVKDLSALRPSLESAFLTLTGKDYRE